MGDEPLTDTSHLRAGDVLIVATRRESRQTGRDYWQKKFCVVAKTPATRNGAQVFDLSWPGAATSWSVVCATWDQILTFVPPERWPDGVKAMRMRLIMTGKLKLGED